MIRLENVLKISFQDVLKTSWRCLEDVFARRLENVLKTSWRRMAKTNILVLTKTSSEDVRLRRTYSSWSRRLEDVFWRRRRKTPSRRLQEVFIKTNVCWVHGSEIGIYGIGVNKWSFHFCIVDNKDCSVLRGMVSNVLIVLGIFWRLSANLIALDLVPFHFPLKMLHTQIRKGCPWHSLSFGIVNTINLRNKISKFQFQCRVFFTASMPSLFGMLI